jgi:Protein of unknown function (DUF3108)
MNPGRRCIAWRRSFSLLIALAICSGSARAEDPDLIFLRFEVFAGPGLHFLTLQVSVEQSQERYSLTVDAETRGVADLFVDLRSRLEARGRVSGDALFPDAMRAETHRRGIDLHTRIDYGTNGAVVAEVTPPPTGEVTPVSAAQMRGTIDQLSAYLQLARHLAARSACTLALQVFDGRRRYDLTFTDLPPEVLPGFPSETRVCQMRRRRIAGFPIDRGGDQAADQGKLVFARLVPGDVMIPVRMEFGSEFGLFIANLAELRGRGVELRLTE